MSSKRRKYIVTVPVTVKVCVEVEAPNKEAAIIAANETCEEVIPLYTGNEPRLDRPRMLGFNCDENTWFDQDALDYEIFLSDKAEAEQVKE